MDGEARSPHCYFPAVAVRPIAIIGSWFPTGLIPAPGSLAIAIWRPTIAEWVIAKSADSGCAQVRIASVLLCLCWRPTDRWQPSLHARCIKMHLGAILICANCVQFPAWPERSQPKVGDRPWGGFRTNGYGMYVVDQGDRDSTMPPASAQSSY